MSRSFLRALPAGLLLFCLFAAPALTDEPVKEFKGRLPNGFGKIGLDFKQKESIYSLQAEYQGKIDALEKQIEAMKAERDQKILGVLTQRQKDLLAELQAEKEAKKLPEKPIAEITPEPAVP